MLVRMPRAYCLNQDYPVQIADVIQRFEGPAAEVRGAVAVGKA